MSLGTDQQINASEDPREAELVLTLEVGGDAPLQNEHVNGIFSVHRKVGDIKLAGGMGDLGISLELSVDVQIKSAVNSIKVDIIPLTTPLPDLKPFDNASMDFRRGYVAA